MSEELIKLLLQVGIQALGKLIPALGSFLGGPLGFLAGLAISWLTGILYDLVERLSRYSGIDHRYLEIANALKATEKKYLDAVDNPDIPVAEKEKAYEDFKEAVRNIKFGPAGK